ncbi:Anti-sigma regulatory factor (Ser/Thr protein kinase) [Pseudobutyrivibrio sp. YE44]|uniref:ATP-binding protein n=1 Tax=Pseudobutyrivibrio sp. YE44 TaxID=1520802 RepID=UPI00088BF649|nr:ATP-binding protein [Pseudobutyrivibrio sp. YE44]SDB50741.1 Anti-sigma regulatory factor (Ser/Thr protein kinase) [Pseudobutyrivibrio sp. YE44]
MKEIRIDASIENVERLVSILDEQLEAVDCPMKAQLQLDVAVEEIFSNISHYAYGENKGQVSIRMDISPERGLIEFMDQGEPFNPLEKEDPDVEAAAESNQLGGLGIYIVKESMDEVSYEYRDRKNVLTIKKYF